MIKTDILIIGAGPTGLFTVFEAGLLKLKCHLIDSLPIPGGQCSEIYPKKPIYDIPSHPEILAGDLVDKLLEQIRPFNPTYTLGEKVLKMDKISESRFRTTTNKSCVSLICFIRLIEAEKSTSTGLKVFKVIEPILVSVFMKE